MLERTDTAHKGPSSQTVLSLTVRAQLVLNAADGTELLRAGLGVAGARWILDCNYDAGMRFYGLGEKSGSLEKTGVRTKFWNTDVWADFDWARIIDNTADPLYVAIPYVVVRHAGHWIGFD